jgi:hypothetical protein
MAQGSKLLPISQPESFPEKAAAFGLPAAFLLLACRLPTGLSSCDVKP